MILAGIDEAGYGPLLGPLVVGCAAFELPDVDASADIPCLWKRLGKFVSKTRSKTARKIHVNDSKLVYSPSTGLKELERSVLALAAAAGQSIETLDTLLSYFCPHAVPDLAEHAWYVASAGERFPIEQDGLPIKLFANGLSPFQTAANAACVLLSARVVPERQFNRMVTATRNKSDALFSIAAVHLDHLLRTYGDQGLVIVCDRQGGRSHYGRLLMQMFEDWTLTIEQETDGHSAYLLTNGNRVARIAFREKAEAACMPVAVASMVSKYLRESLMRRYNAWWRTHLPDLAPTAGYHGDGQRFLADIDSVRRSLNVRDEDLIRCR